MCRTDKSHSLRWRHGNLSELKQCIDEFENLVNFCLAIFLKDDISNHKGSLLESSNGSDADIDFSCLSSLNRSLLQGLLKDGNIIMACVVGQLFTSSAAILKIKNLLSSPMVLDQEEKCGQVRSTSTSLLIGASLFLLSELAEVDVQQRPSLIWLNGLLKYLEVLGSYFPFIEIVSSRDAYTKIIDMHVKVLARCIALEGGISNLGNSEAGALLGKGRLQASPCSLDHNLTEFKDRLRLSFLMYVKKPLESHLFAVIQVLERALVGFKDSCPTRYDIETGSLGGGSVAPIVAAGLECMDMVLESVSSTCTPRAAYSRETTPVVAHNNMDPFHPLQRAVERCIGMLGDSIKVLLMCLESVDSGLLNKEDIPLWDIQDAVKCASFLRRIYEESRRMRSIGVFRRDLAVRVFRAVVSGSVHAVASGSIPPSRVPCRHLGIRARLGVRAHCHLGIRAHRLPRNSCARLGFVPLSLRQIPPSPLVTSPVSPFAPEVDEALRPGVYALVDICSPSDLQQLHVGLGEGPCRNTLSVLKHDYEVNFKYTGKV
ncbi:hypothetical protein EJ110_NYTH30532 [Nymphaea thermarum]|nr:hypothetical protein EJ110_NYTH30532 [Nymphaea thermarum]